MSYESKEISPDVTYLLSIISPLVTEKEEVNIERENDEQGVHLILAVAQGDMGRIIGKGGATAIAIRTLLRQFGGTTKSFISLTILEPEGSTRNYKKNGYTA